MRPTLKVKKTLPNAILPKRATAGAAAMDLAAALDVPVTVPANGTAVIPTGIAIELPSPEYAALIFSRSGHGFHHGVSLINAVGVIDSDYRGAINIGLINRSERDFTVHHGDRIAQLMITSAFLLPVEEAETLTDTARGEGGFGSTGLS